MAKKKAKDVVKKKPANVAKKKPTKTKAAKATKPTKLDKAVEAARKQLQERPSWGSNVGLGVI